LAAEPEILAVRDRYALLGLLERTLTATVAAIRPA
jgi:hypothetical protein